MLFSTAYEAVVAGYCPYPKRRKLSHFHGRQLLLVPLLLLAIFTANAAGGQEPDLEKIRVTLEMRSEPLDVLFNRIESLTKLRFAYSEQEVKNHTLVLEKKERNIKELLKLALKNTSLGFQQVSNKIIISRKRLPTTEEQPVQLSISSLEDTTIKGRVLLSSNDLLQPGSGVNVLEKGTKNGVQTNEQGEFIIRVSKSSILQFSMTGYKPQEHRVSRGRLASVVLLPNVSGLDEVIVTGYKTQEKREITGAISSIKSSDIENKPIQSFDQAMQGKMAGVLVQSATGVPGGAVKVEIRGQGSISAGTQPLYIVDGVPINADDGSTINSSNPLSYLNPNDIESIEVLKDAAAASIYGAQAANGVVLVTTRSGKSGPTAFTVNYNAGITEHLPLITMMNTQEFLQARMEAKQNRYPGWSAAQVRTEILRENRLPINLTDAEIAALPSYDWQSAVYRTGINHNIDVSAAGGNSKTTFRLSGSYNKSEGSVIGTDYTRGTAKLRLQHTVNDKLSFNGDVNLSTITQNGPVGSYGSNTNLSTPQYSAPMILPFVPLYNDDGSPNVLIGGFPGTFRYNPIYTTEANTVEGKTTTIYASFGLKYNILKGLTLNSSVGLDYRTIQSTYYLDPTTQEGNASQGRISVQERKPKTFVTTHTLNYTRTIKKNHTVSALLGAEYRSYERGTTRADGQGFPSNKFRELQSAAVITSATSTWTGVKRAGLFTQANYRFKKQYMLSAILRYDGSSRFGVNNMFGWFPAFSAGWDIAQESFLKKNGWIDQLKLRAGYGETGNDQIGNFSARSLYSSGITFNGEPGIRPAAIGNPDLRWERNATTNLGVDYSIFSRRVNGAIDVFRRVSKDLLLEQPVLWSGGYSSIYKNVGEVTNEGLEIEVNTVNLRTLKFKWQSSFNITFIRNRVQKLYAAEKILPGDPSVRIGFPLQTNFVAQYAGVNAATGRPLWWDNDGSLSYRPGAQGSNSFLPYPRGSRLSDYYGGFNNTFSYRGWELLVFFQYDMGRELYNLQTSVWARKGDGPINGSEWYYDNRWTSPGQVTTVPRAIDGEAEVNASSGRLSSSRFLEDASYIRLKQVALSWSLSSKLRKKLHVKDLKILIQANNLYTWTKWTGYDPEFYIDDANFTSNTGVIPQTRNYALGIQVKL